MDYSPNTRRILPAPVTLERMDSLGAIIGRWRLFTGVVDTPEFNPATRVIAVSGRFALSPRRAPAGVVFRFVHGDQDPVIDPRFSVAGAEALQALGADARVQLVPGLGHGIDERAARGVLEAMG